MSADKYSDIEVIFENDNAIIQKGSYDGQFFVLKNYKINSLTDVETKVQNEIMITQKLFPSDTSSYDLNGIPVLVKPYVEGLTLDDFIRNWNFDQLNFLKIALKLVHKLADIHKQGIIHLDLNPSNIIYNPVNQEVEIIDFGSAYLYSHRNSYLGNPERVDCDLYYISPEQTGRINGIVDFSTDFYSLGAVLYEFATSRKVFTSEKPLELVHNHLAKVPTNPNKYNSKLSKSVAEIILKLLSKNSQDRYKSDFGLIHDLEKCIEDLKNNNVIVDFEIGENDINEKFKISPKIYGRNQEIRLLQNAYNQACLSHSKFTFISGYSGTGKSRLVAETHIQLAKANGNFIKGKFDQVNRDIPYFAWIQAFNNFFELLMTENEETLTYWKNKLQEYLPESLDYLGQIVTNINWLFKDLNTEKVSYSAETQNRFKFVITSFIECLASKDYPIIIFIDDWQWADNASIDLLNKILSDDNINYLFFIGAYRGNEIKEDHPFNSILNAIDTSSSASLIEIDSLNKADTSSILEDTFYSSGTQIEELNELIYDRTEGNALYYTEFLNALKDEDLIRFDRKNRKWTWDIDLIKRTILSDNILELLVRKVTKFDPKELKILQHASCIGAKFELELLSQVSGETERDVEKYLLRALREGLIYSNSNVNVFKGVDNLMKKGFQFAHDRISQGIYAMLEEDEKTTAHSLIGELLVERMSEESIDQNIFSIIEHLNKGLPKIEDSKYLEKIAGLNLKASEKAQGLVDFSSAHKYASQGIEIIKNIKGETTKSLLIKMQLKNFELGLLLNDPEIDKLEKAIYKLEPTQHESAVLIRIKISNLLTTGKLQEAVEIGLDYLKRQGYTIEANPAPQDIIDSSIRTTAEYKDREIADLINLPLIEDPFLLELTEIFQAVNAASYYSNQLLWVLINFETTRFYIKNGLSQLAPLTFAAYGASLIVANKDFKSGVAFGNLSLEVIDKLPSNYQINKSLFCYYALISWWESHISESIDGLRETLNLSLACGDMEFVGHSSDLSANTNACCCQDLRKANFKFDQDIKFLSKKWEYFAPNSLRIHIQYLKCLADPNNTEGTVCGDLYTFDDNKDTHVKNQEIILMSSHYTGSYRMSYFFKNYQKAYEYLKITDDVKGDVSLFIFYFNLLFNGLILGEIYFEVDNEKKNEIEEKLKEILETFRLCAEVNPINFENKYHLINATYLKILGKDSEALNEFELAIESSKTNRFIHEEGIAWDRAADMYEKLNKPTIARKYIEAAYNCYYTWGALAICTRYKKLYPWLAEVLIADSVKSKRASSSNLALASIDLASILKSSEVLIGETDFKKLLKKLILIAIENAGAEKGYLLLKSNDDLDINVYGDADSKTHFYENQTFKTFNKISKKVVNYVFKTGNTLILPDAANDPRFEDDQYLKVNQIKSVFCFPIMNQGILIGLLYLENNLTTHAFTKERVELMNLLSGQIAISLENTLLIENLEEKVKERTIEIEKEKETSEKLLLNILPKATATELRETGKAAPRYYDEVTVMFLDFKDFSIKSKKLDYKEVVGLIDEYFKAFDAIIELYYIEKIKTIGDAYMCACGLPIERKDHAILMTQASMHLQKVIGDLKKNKEKNNLPYFEARIGIHTGPVVAGVVGSKKFAYDIWGDSVNIAARLESSCEVGKITVSLNTYNLIKDTINCENRGKIPVKNMDDLEMYYVTDDFVG